MSVTINASTSSGLVVTPDNSGNVLLQYNGVAAPAFSAYGSTNPTLNNNTWTKCVFNTERFDTAGYFDSTTNYRFTPLVAGYYQINAAAYVYPGANAFYIAIYKNGSAYFNNSTANNSQGPSCSISTTMYLNGSTDYIEIYYYQNSGGGLTSGFTDFSGCLLRGA